MAARRQSAAAGPARRGHRFLLVLLVAASGLLGLVLAPFAGILFSAAVFAVVLHPWQDRLAARLGDRRHLAAALLTAGLAIGVMAPLGWLAAGVLRQMVAGVDEVVTTVSQEGTDGLVARLPEDLRPGVRQALALLPAGWLPAAPSPSSDRGSPEVGRPPSRRPTQEAGPPVDAGAAIRWVAGTAKAVAVGAGRLLFEGGVLLVAVFFLLVQGQDLVRWIRSTLPLPVRQVDGLLTELHDVTVAVFVATMASAAIQALVAGLGYLLAGIPLLGVAFLATFVAAFLPAVGGATVVVVVGTLLVLADSVAWGVFLIVWGLLPVSLCDNLVRPLLAGHRLRLPGAVLFFAMLGGLAMFGPMGVIAGPLIVSFFLVVVRALARRPATQTSNTGA